MDEDYTVPILYRHVTCTLERLRIIYSIGTPRQTGEGRRPREANTRIIMNSVKRKGPEALNVHHLTERRGHPAWHLHGFVQHHVVIRWHREVDAGHAVQERVRVYPQKMEVADLSSVGTASTMNRKGFPSR